MRQKVGCAALVLALFCTLLPAAQGVGRPGQAVTLSAGGSHSAAVDQKGDLWVWGSNQYGQLGNGGGGNDAAAMESGQTYPIQTVPVKVMEGVVSVSAGESHTAAIREDGTLWLWGRNDSGQLGNGGGGNASFDERRVSTTLAGEQVEVVSEPIQNTPQKIMDRVAAVSAGGSLTAAVRQDGSLWVWGTAGLGSSGIPGGDSNVPVKILDQVSTVSVGKNFVLALKTDGSLWSWGVNDYGQLGVGTAGAAQGPSWVMDHVAAISAGRRHAAAIKEDGTLWLWGWNDYGQLGNGTWNSSSLPVKVLDHVTWVSCGGYHTVAILDNGSLWTWGDNRENEQGIARTDAMSSGLLNLSCKLSPYMLLTNVSMASAGQDFVLAVRTDGTVDGWGNNDCGKLGGGTPFENRQTPGEVFSLAVRVPDGVETPQTAAAATLFLRVGEGEPVPVQSFVLRDRNGVETQYVKLRDVAYLLSGTASQFEVGWENNGVVLTTGEPYTPVGGELTAPFSGPQPYEAISSTTVLDGAGVDIEAILLTDSAGNGYTYYHLNDLSRALGFQMDWSSGGEHEILLQPAA